MSEHVKKKCPLCGGKPTEFVHPYSDGEVKLPFAAQVCSTCDLPCKWWNAIASYKVTADHLERCEKLLSAYYASHNGKFGPCECEACAAYRKASGE